MTRPAEAEGARLLHVVPPRRGDAHHARHDTTKATESDWARRRVRGFGGHAWTCALFPDLRSPIPDS